MSSIPSVAPAVRDLTGPAALPRANGELVFGAPWEGRAFGTALAVIEHLGLDWETFRVQLVAAVAADDQRPYYESWLAALEALVVDQGLVTAPQLQERAERSERGAPG